MPSPARLPDGRLPRSLTHLHLARVIEAEVSRGPDRPLRVLDAGCGNGHLIDYIQSFFTAHHPRLSLEIQGFDVADPGVQGDGFFEQAVSELTRSHPDVNWPSRLSLIHQADPWPFPEEHFDFVISNQVLEHVVDLRHFLQQTNRVLRHGGTSVNLFPVREVLLEGHVGVPLAHRIGSHDLRAAYLESVANLGLDGLGPLVRQPGMTASEWGQAGSDCVAFMTRYRSWREIAGAAQLVGFRASYRYTPEFYWSKITSLFGQDYRRGYASERNPIADALLFHILKRISGVTVVLEKQNTFRAGDFVTRQPQPGVRA